MTYMSLSHMYRMHVDYLGWQLDFTGPQMILTIKLSSFAYNLYDGTRVKQLQQPTGDGLKDKINKDFLRYSIAHVSLTPPMAIHRNRGSLVCLR
jgi:hypothetical protein